MRLFTSIREQSFYASHVLLRLKRPLITISFVLDESLDNNQLAITETTKRLGGVNLYYSLQGSESSILVIESDEPNMSVRNTGDAIVSGGGIANTGIMLGSKPSAENVCYLPVPLESNERIMQFRSSAESLKLAFGPGEYGYAII